MLSFKQQVNENLLFDIFIVFSYKLSAMFVPLCLAGILRHPLI